MRYISRGSYDAFRECPRAGFWRYLSGPFGGSDVRGVDTPSTHPALGLGQAWHVAAEGLLRGVSGADAAREGIAFAEEAGLGVTEQNWLLAICLAWERGAAEDFFNRYDVVSIEEELETALTTNVVLYSRADAILRDRADGTLWVLNWKTAGDVKNWNRKWFYDIQGWTESLAAEAKLGEPVVGCIYMGVWKGPMWNGSISSRLLYGYKYRTRDGSYTYATENSGSGERFSVAAEHFPFGDGIAAWVSWLDKDYLKRFFVESAPQIRQDEVVNEWLKQVITHESDIDHILAEGTEEEIKAFFWQNWGESTCGRCAFNALCTLKATPEELVKDGLLVPRKRSPRDEAESRSRTQETEGKA